MMPVHVGVVVWLRFAVLTNQICSETGRNAKGLGRRLTMKTTAEMLDYDDINRFTFRFQSRLACAFSI